MISSRPSVLHQGGAAFHPITVVAIQGAVHIANFGMVNVATHHAIKSASLGLLLATATSKSLMKFTAFLTLSLR
jgi:hypothetical protein